MQRQNTFLAIPASPKHFFCHSRYAKTLAGHIWSHLVTTWQHLVTPGNIWSHLSPETADKGTQTAASI